MATTAQKTYSFRVTLAGVTDFDDAMTDALFEAGCDDGHVGSRDGVVFVHFDREAGSLAEAVGSAIGDIEKAGQAVARVDVGNDQGAGRGPGR